MNYFNDLRLCIFLCINILSCNGFFFFLNIMNIIFKINYFVDCYFICD